MKLGAYKRKVYSTKKREWVSEGATVNILNVGRSLASSKKRIRGR